MYRPLRVLAALAVSFAACARASAVGGPAGARAGTSVERIRVDSADALKAARSAQSRFESTRWSHLPWTWRSGSASRCDEIVGRFCLWFGADEPDWIPPDEPERVTAARQSLIAMLAAAGEARSSDPWIVGQHVRYLIEAGRQEEAAGVARRCSAERWWCLALAGYALHASADFAAAERLFDDALAAMPEDERRRWTDLSVLLDHEARRKYERLNPAARATLELRFWWLADPFVSIPGNERRTEHFTRHVLARLAEDARSPERVSWGDDLRELLLRYGAAAAWQRVRPSGMSSTPTSVVSHFARGSLEMSPPWDVIADPAAAAEQAWPIDAAKPRSTYAPSHSHVVHALEQQVALFRRGDSMRVVAAWRVPSDSLPDTATVAATLALSASESGASSREEGSFRGREGALTAMASARSTVLSLELLASAERQAGRARFGVRPPWDSRSVVALSDLLLISAGDPLPASLDEAIPLARPGTTLARRERVGVFWELYAENEPPRQTFVTLSLTRGRVGWARRLAERIGIRDEFAGLKLQWEERAGSAVNPRAVVLDFERLEPGDYVLELVVAPVGRQSVSVSRSIQIVP